MWVMIRSNITFSLHFAALLAYVTDKKIFQEFVQCSWGDFIIPRRGVLLGGRGGEVEGDRIILTIPRFTVTTPSFPSALLK